MATGATATRQQQERLPREAPSIVLRGLRKAFGTCRALDGIDLGVHGASMLGVVGPDGAGKTTLLRSLAGLLEVDAEEARVLGFDLAGDTLALRARVGYVPQAFSLYRELSIDENLTFTARLHGIADDEFRRRRDELLESTGLSAFAGRLAGALSGGMKQKLAVANAMLPHPDLLVLDEPTAGIDVVARREIMDMLLRLERSTLIVLSTSYLEEAELCDHLLYLRDGRVVAQGSPAALEAATGSDAWRVWTDEADAVRAAVAALPWVEHSRECGRFVRLEVSREAAPSPDEVCRVLSNLGGEGLVALAERAPTDLESTLLALARHAGVQ